jgi:competence protein ComEC
VERWDNSNMNIEPPLGECFFLDVGQGMANVIALPGGRVLIIDVGPRNAWPIIHRLLLDRGVTLIERLLISHNDDDHIGGLDLCAMSFADRIAKNGFFLLQDRPLKPGDALDITLKMVEEKVMPEPRRAEAASIEQPSVIWQEKGLSLELWYPTMTKAVRAMSRGRPNDCCAVALLRVGPGRILFTGDAGAKSWSALAEAHRDSKLEIDVMTVPHHGGSLGCPWPGALETVVKAKIAIISVGTHNSYGHPRPSVVAGCKNAGAQVLCTQITDRCHPVAKLTGSHVTDISEYSVSYVRKTANTPSGKIPVACAGTVVSILRETGVEIPNLENHATRMKELKSPLCTSSAAKSS